MQLQRQQVLTAAQLHPEWRPTTIFNKLQGPTFNLSLNTIRRILQRQSTTVHIHGAPLKLTPAVRAKILRLLRGSNVLNNDRTRKQRHSVTAVVRKLKQGANPITLHESTIRRVAKKAGLKWRLRRRGPQITHHNRDCREDFWRKHRHRSLLRWQEFVWTDSVPLTQNHSTNTHNEGLWVYDTDPVPPTTRLRRDDSTLHTYGALCRHGLLGPYFITGSINQETYQKQILTPMLRDIKAAFGAEPFLFQQDGAGAHRAKTTQQWLAEQHIQFIAADDWPGNSPDISPVENCWCPLKEFCSPPGAYNISHPVLRRRATLWFHRFSVADCRKYLNTMPARMRYLRAVDFWSIPF